MKFYGIVLLLFVVGFIVGCTESNPVVNAPVQTEQTTPPTQNAQTEPTTPVENTQTPPPVEDTPVETTPSGISLSALSAHDSRTDCWIAYKGKVYDITEYVPVHPGGASQITPYCGTSSDFEKAFSNQHGTSKVNKLIEEGTYKGDLQ